MRKKGLWIGLLVLLLGVLCALFLPLDVLPLEDVSADMTFDADGNVYMTANDGAHSRILSADREGRVLYCYEEDSRADGRVSGGGWPHLFYPSLRKRALGIHGRMGAGPAGYGKW